MNRWRVGEDRGNKETDGCPLTPTTQDKTTESGTDRPKDNDLQGWFQAT
jgi:hypothetical protein